MAERAPTSLSARAEIIQRAEVCLRINTDLRGADLELAAERVCVSLGLIDPPSAPVARRSDTFTRAEKDVSTALLKAWRDADVRLDDRTGELVKSVLDSLALPWVPIDWEKVDA